MPKNFYSGSQELLATGAQNLISIVTPAPATYGLTAPQVASYTTVTASYVSALTLATNAGTRTSVTVASKNAAKAVLRAATIDIARIIRSTPTVTNAQLLDLGLNERLAPQPQPVPVDAPAVDIMSVVDRRVKIRIHNNESESKRAKAAGAIGANVFTFVGPTAPEDATEYFFQGMTTRAITEIQFPNSVPNGAMVWVSCCWVGTRGQIGQASPPIGFSLQGGLTTANATTVRLAA